jgi:hypothetical protein
MSFAYLIERIRRAEMISDPFRHVYIGNFLNDDHFAEITRAKEIDISDLDSDNALFDRLFENGYKIIDFPGCITDWKEYVRWHADPAQGHDKNNSACEGFGVTLRLMNPGTPILRDLIAFLESGDFQAALAAKFDLDPDTVFYDCGLQKHLDGYEISPHPDIRKKAATYMVNINPRPDSEECNHHTHYLRLRDQRRYVQAFWEGNTDLDRCWVPWDWCDTVKTQPKNNSIVLFSPADDTMHAVKAKYDHLKGQRTQLYGNLWYRDAPHTRKPEWTDLDVPGHLGARVADNDRRLKIGPRIKRKLANVTGWAPKKSDYVIDDRLSGKR